MECGESAGPKRLEEQTDISQGEEDQQMPLDSLFVPSLRQNSDSPQSSHQRFLVSSTTNSPPRKIRSLEEIYESNYVAFVACEPQNYQEAAKEEI